MYLINASGANLSRPTTHSFPAIQVPFICPPLSRPHISSGRLQGLVGFELADTVLERDQLSIEILCGLNVFWTLVRPAATHVSSGLALMETAFGWVLSGVVSADGAAGQVRVIL